MARSRKLMAQEKTRIISPEQGRMLHRKHQKPFTQIGKCPPSLLLPHSLPQLPKIRVIKAGFHSTGF
jgi:hypothetical protein